MYSYHRSDSWIVNGCRVWHNSNDKTLPRINWSTDLRGPTAYKLHCPRTKDTIHLSGFVDFPRVSRYARGASEDLNIFLSVHRHYFHIRDPLFDDARNLSWRKMHREMRTIFRYNRLISHDRSRACRFDRVAALLVFLTNPAEIPSLFCLFPYLSAGKNNPMRERTERISFYGGLPSERF